MSEWYDGRVLAHGIHIHYTRTGGNKPPVVLLHGFTDNGLCWTPVARVLEQDYDVIMPDTRGHGLSDGPETGFSLEQRADDVAGLIQELALERPRLLGHSMGAAIAALLAADRPELVRSILLEDPPWFVATLLPLQTPGQDIKNNSFYKLIVGLKALTPDERLVAARASNPTWSEDELGPWIDSKEQLNIDVFIADTPPPPWREVVSRITCPILLITGDPEKGALITPERAQEASHLWRNGQVVYIAGAGHNIRRDQFSHYMQVITTFLREQ
jgi:N-formylmaleamate deformylase